MNAINPAMSKVMKPAPRSANGIDASRVIRFSFGGRILFAHPGDTLASALLANGIRLTARSFKYHRPRGILSAGPEEPNALMELGRGARREPNSRATVTEVFDGLVASPQNAWPSLAFDAMSVNALLSPVFTAGFYYKTFMWPASFWEKLYEPMIRRAAGLGRASDDADPDVYEKTTVFCDVLVVGSGPAGISAAMSAAHGGARVVLCEQDSLLGGRLRAEATTLGDQPGWAWVQEVEAALRRHPNVRIMTRTCVVGRYDGGTHAALERVTDHLPDAPKNMPRQRLWRIVAKTCIAATGAIERPIVFPNNDRPGIMLAGSVRTYVNRFGVTPGRRAVIYANNDDGLRTALDLHRAGSRIVAIVDSRPLPSKTAQAVSQATNCAVLNGARILNTFGRLGVCAVLVEDAEGRTCRVSCDLIAMSGGWNPDLALTTHHGTRPIFDDTLNAFVPGATPDDLFPVGMAAGTLDTSVCLLDGARAGTAAAGAAGFATDGQPEIPMFAGDDAYGVEPLWHALSVANVKLAGRAFVDFQNDVTLKDIRLAAREGFRSVEHLKRYTTLGMATDQGKTANVNALAIMAEETQRSIPQTGTTLIRPPVQPVAMGALAGPHRDAHFKPRRLPPTHAFAVEHGAAFTANGLWMRAQWYPLAGETWQQTVDREVGTVRGKVGICDVTTLGKIDIQGPDAATLISRVYVNAWAGLPVGRARYGLMLREDGFAFDDGTTARLGENHYVMTTTTANAGAVMQHLEFCHQWLWPELDVQFISVTDEWAQIAVAGPHSRDVLAQLVDAPFDLSHEAFGYMAAAQLTVCGGTPARLFRLSFSGELAYEIAVPARFGDALARRLMQAGTPYGISPYGTEALGVLRIEKGHPAGPELNGQTTAHDLGMARMLSTRKDFVGAVMARRAVLVDEKRPRLVGLQSLDVSAPIVAGSHLLPHGAEANAAADQGWISSACWSPTIGAWIGLGFLVAGPSRHGEIVSVHNPLAATVVSARVVSPVFVDPEGSRLHG